MQLDLRGHVADPLGDQKRVAVGALRLLVVTLGVLEVVAQREHREHRLVLVGVARELDRALEVLARLGDVADAPKDAPEDPVRAPRRAHLPRALG